MSDRSVRNCCSHKLIKGAFITRQTWNIPEDTVKQELAIIPYSIIDKKVKYFSN